MDNQEGFLSSKYAGEEFSIKFFERHPEAAVRKFFPHKHTQIEIALFVSGSGKYKTEYNDYSIKAGDIFVFRSNEVHHISEIYPEEHMTLFNIQFAHNILWDSDIFPHPNLLMPFISATHRISNRLDRNNPHIENVRKLIFRIGNEFKNEATEHSLMIKLTLSELLIQLMRHFFPDLVNAPKDIALDAFRMIEKSMNHINEHLAEPIKLAELSSIAHMSNSHYTTMFKRFNGITPWEYLTEKRIAKAIYLLLNESHTMLDIAVRCGFNSTANFNRAFKKHTGKTPREFKAQQYLLEF